MTDFLKKGRGWVLMDNGQWTINNGQWTVDNCF